MRNPSHHFPPRAKPYPRAGASTSAHGVPSLYVWIPVEAPLVCGADRHGSTARRTHEEKVELVRSTNSSKSMRATSREFLRLLSVFFRCTARRVVTIYDLILAWFLVYAIENFDLYYRSLRVSQQYVDEKAAKYCFICYYISSSWIGGCKSEFSSLIVVGVFGMFFSVTQYYDL